MQYRHFFKFNIFDKFSMYKKWFILCKILLKERDNMKDLRDYY